MITEKEAKAIRRAEARYAKKPPTARDLVALARAYKTAHLKWSAEYDRVGEVRGLDQWDPKHMKWENAVYRAENARDLAKEVLLAAARAVRT